MYIALIIQLHRIAFLGFHDELCSVSKKFYWGNGYVSSKFQFDLETVDEGTVLYHCKSLFPFLLSYLLLIVRVLKQNRTHIFICILSYIETPTQRRVNLLFVINISFFKF